MRIIVVDDKEEERYLAETLLKGSGYEVETATNGMEALEKLRAGGFDMIVSDVLMPVMDGFRLCRECKGDEKLKDIPFVFHTASYKDERDEELASKVGADRFVRKPTEPEEFIRIIQGLFRDMEEGKMGPKRRVVEEEKEVLKLYSERLIAKLEKRTLELEAEIAQRKRSEERVEHLNRVLRAIRGVNQLIIREKDRQSLLEGACDNLIKTRGFHYVWIALLDESGSLLTHAEAGLGEDFLPIVEQLKRGGLPACCQQALRQAGVAAIKDPSSTCSGCPLTREPSRRGALATRLEYGKKVYGVLVVSGPVEFIADEEEQSLLQEVAGDIAFALHDIELEEEHKQAEEALRESEDKYRKLFELGSDALFLIEVETGRILDLSDTALEMYGYSREEALQMKNTDFSAEPAQTRQATVEHEQQIPVRYHKKKDGTIFPTDISVAYFAWYGKEVCIAAIRDITERRKAQQRLEDAFIDLTETVSRAMETRDPYTAGHQRKVAELTRLVGEKVGLSAEELQGLYICALLHDIGKMSIPESILTKPGRLTEEEWSLIKVHARQGYEILKETTLPWPVAEMALHHHERLDGSGYPDGISGDQLSLEVRIVGACDVVEAMGSHRPYRPARSRAEIVEELRGGRGTKYEARVADILLEMVAGGAVEFGSG